MRTLQECHEVIQRAIGKAPTPALKRLAPVAQKISECLHGVGLTEWEEEFLLSIEDRIADDWALTPNQQDTLDRIWREKA